MSIESDLNRHSSTNYGRLFSGELPAQNLITPKYEVVPHTPVADASSADPLLSDSERQQYLVSLDVGETAMPAVVTGPNGVAIVRGKIRKAPPVLGRVATTLNSPIPAPEPPVMEQPRVRKSVPAPIITTVAPRLNSPIPAAESTVIEKPAMRRSVPAPVVPTVAPEFSPRMPVVESAPAAIVTKHAPVRKHPVIRKNPVETELPADSVASIPSRDRYLAVDVRPADATPATAVVRTDAPQRRLLSGGIFRQ